VRRMIDFAFEMIDTLHKYNDSCAILKSRSLSLNLRIGINTGPVVAGIIGRSRYEKKKIVLYFSLFFSPSRISFHSYHLFI
jgi:class 3 adenylate cyclase